MLAISSHIRSDSFVNRSACNNCLIMHAAAVLGYIFATLLFDIPWYHGIWIHQRMLNPRRVQPLRRRALSATCGDISELREELPLTCPETPAAMMEEQYAEEQYEQGQYPLDGQVNADTGCWGAALISTADGCTRGFIPGKGHLKNKFCPDCVQHGIFVDARRVRAITESMHGEFANARGAGLWTTIRTQDQVDHRYRLVNQTHLCKGPRLVVFEAEAINADGERRVVLRHACVELAGAPTPTAGTRAGASKL